MFPIYNIFQIHQIIVQEIRNPTGITMSDDSDASIRAYGTASAVEGLYQHQNYIQRQLFAHTADEPYLYIHAEEVGTPRTPSGRASGTVKAISNVAVTINEGQKLTDGKGHFYRVISTVELLANEETLIAIEADQMGAAWNYNGTELLWVSPAAGLKGTADIVNLTGGTDVEALEVWRERILQRKRIGASRDRAADIEIDLREIPGIAHVYVYSKRRGIGSLDVAITAAGNPPTLPSTALLNTAQAALDASAGFCADCRVYQPDVVNLDITAVITGAVDLEAVRQVIRSYMAELGPAKPYQEAVLNARIMNLANATDVVLNPSANVVPQVNWMRTEWLRLGHLDVRAAV